MKLSPGKVPIGFSQESRDFKEKDASDEFEGDGTVGVVSVETRCNKSLLFFLIV